MFNNTPLQEYSVRLRGPATVRRPFVSREHGAFDIRHSLCEAEVELVFHRDRGRAILPVKRRAERNSRKGRILSLYAE